MDETSVLQTVEDAVLRQGDHNINVLCHAIHTEPASHLTPTARGSKSVHHFFLVGGFLESLAS